MSNDIETITKIKLFFTDKVKKGHILNWNELIYPFEIQLTPITRSLISNWYNSITNYHFLNGIPSIFEEIFIHDAHDIKIKHKNELKDHHQEMTSEDIDLCFEIICIKSKIDWNYNNPFASFYFRYKHFNFRLTLLHKKINPKGKAKYFLRNIKEDAFLIKDFELEDSFIQAKIQKRANILIAGATGSGKTSLINSILSFIPKEDHLIILEDTYEIQTKKDNTTRLISSQDKAQSMNDLLTYSLRMSPDRIILGELRSFEVTTYVQALNTGHKGVISTIHANTAKDAIHRAAILFQLHSGINMNYELALKLISSNIDYVIFMENKKVNEVIKVYASEGSTLFFDKVA